MKPASATLALILAGCAAMPVSDPSLPSPAALAAAESAFAAQSVREGMRAAFLAWLAPDATLFRGGPVNGPAAIAANPDPPIVLDWRPAFVEVAASGELGLSTGPWKITSRGNPGAPPRFGQFVSVWKRAPGGDWRVHVDLGIAHADPALADAPLQAQVTPPVADGDPASTLAAAEADFAQRAASTGNGAAYAQWLSPSTRVYREGHAPYLGRQAALASPAASADRLAWAVERHETSASGDLGYAMGRYAVAGGPTTGHFVRVWRRESSGWRIALDVVNALPPR